MLILTGPPGSGKTHTVLERLRRDLAGGAGRVRLIVPTATMAEHLRNQLAREGLLLRAGSIQTFSKFVDSLAGAPPEASKPVFQSLVRAALEAPEAAAFERVREFPGFQAALAALIDELESAGWTPPSDEPSRSASEEAIAGVFTRVRLAVQERGLSTRAGRLRTASARVRGRQMAGVDAALFDGFYVFAPVELELIAALAESGIEVVLTLPDWEGANLPKRTLAASGFKERRLEQRRPAPRVALVAAANMEQEAREIARRILAETAAGRPFREIGVIVRGYDPYVPALRTAFERFGIPARYYFPQQLSAHPAVAGIARLVDALLNGWDHERALAAARMLPASEELDRFEFAVLEELPAQGQESLVALAGRRLGELLEAAAELAGGAARPAQRWCARLAALAGLFPSPPVRDGAGHEQAFLWRSHAAAVEAFIRLLGETAEAFGNESEAPLDAFWAEVKANLGNAPFWPRDHRRNVVAVMDAYEARQWELPVAFLCGLIERQFPRHHFEDPLLGDEARLRLRARGVHLRTSSDANAEERFLFQLATTRATESLTLSYPKYNAKGDDNLPSFLLQHYLQSVLASVEGVVDVRPAPARPRVRRSTPAVQDARLLEWLAAKHATLSASSIQRFLACPFAFFAERSLRLTGRPTPPRERLDPPLQGQIAHDVIAACLNMPLMLDQTFEEIFRESTREARVPEGHRTEAVRLEMLGSLREFLRRPLTTGARETLSESDFKLPLQDGISVQGRIDRIDVLPGRKALVIDYKYAPGYRIKSYIDSNEQEQSVQAGLYLLAARAAFRVEPVGMLFCAMRRGVAWDGWVADWPRDETIGTRCDPAYLRGMADKAVAAAMAVAGALRQGRIAPAPSDGSICERCDHRDICRVETQELVTVAGGRSQ
ncbi:MAG: PD-(D/E)XK nuclease family protein [Bryobacteraceae bacterium]|nr:PD-(D/E)XK nuclease family protein [Bryobacteraceae bacterium]